MTSRGFVAPKVFDWNHGSSGSREQGSDQIRTQFADARRNVTSAGGDSPEYGVGDDFDPQYGARNSQNQYRGTDDNRDSASVRNRPRQMKQGGGSCPPSRVVHIGSLALEATEADVKQLGMPFGRITNVLVLKNQAFLEFAEESSAVDMVSHCYANPTRVCQKTCFIQFSRHKQLKTPSSRNVQGRGGAQGTRGSDQTPGDGGGRGRRDHPNQDRMQREQEEHAGSKGAGREVIGRGRERGARGGRQTPGDGGGRGRRDHPNQDRMQREQEEHAGSKGAGREVIGRGRERGARGGRQTPGDGGGRGRRDHPNQDRMQREQGGHAGSEDAGRAIMGRGRGWGAQGGRQTPGGGLGRGRGDHPFQDKTQMEQGGYSGSRDVRQEMAREPLKVGGLPLPPHVILAHEKEVERRGLHSSEGASGPISDVGPPAFHAGRERAWSDRTNPPQGLEELPAAGEPHRGFGSQEWGQGQVQARQQRDGGTKRSREHEGGYLDAESPGIKRVRGEGGYWGPPTENIGNRNHRQESGRRSDGNRRNEDHRPVTERQGNQESMESRQRTWHRTGQQAAEDAAGRGGRPHADEPFVQRNASLEYLWTQLEKHREQDERSDMSISSSDSHSREQMFQVTEEDFKEEMYRRLMFELNSTTNAWEREQQISMHIREMAKLSPTLFRKFMANDAEHLKAMATMQAESQQQGNEKQRPGGPVPQEIHPGHLSSVRPGPPPGLLAAEPHMSVGQQDERIHAVRTGSVQYGERNLQEDRECPLSPTRVMRHGSDFFDVEEEMRRQEHLGRDVIPGRYPNLRPEHQDDYLPLRSRLPYPRVELLDEYPAPRRHPALAIDPQYALDPLPPPEGRHLALEDRHPLEDRPSFEDRRPHEDRPPFEDRRPSEDHRLFHDPPLEDHPHRHPLLSSLDLDLTVMQQRKPDLAVPPEFRSYEEKHKKYEEWLTAVERQRSSSGREVVAQIQSTQPPATMPSERRRENNSRQDRQRRHQDSHKYGSRSSSSSRQRPKSPSTSEPARKRPRTSSVTQKDETMTSGSARENQCKKQSSTQENKTENLGKKGEAAGSEVNVPVDELMLRAKKLVELQQELDCLVKEKEEWLKSREWPRDDPHADPPPLTPAMVQNTKRQLDISLQMKALREGKTVASMLEAEAAAVNLPSDQKEKTVGVHAINCCKRCNLVFNNIHDFICHLSSYAHLQNQRPSSHLWQKEAMKKYRKKDKAGGEKSCPVKGAEMLVATLALFCPLCSELCPDSKVAEAHLKSEQHYDKYKEYVTQHPSYERHYLQECWDRKMATRKIPVTTTDANADTKRDGNRGKLKRSASPSDVIDLTGMSPKRGSEQESEPQSVNDSTTASQPATHASESAATSEKTSSGAQPQTKSGLSGSGPKSATLPDKTPATSSRSSAPAQITPKAQTTPKTATGPTQIKPVSATYAVSTPKSSTATTKTTPKPENTPSKITPKSATTTTPATAITTPKTTTGTTGSLPIPKSVSDVKSTTLSQSTGGVASASASKSLNATAKPAPKAAPPAARQANQQGNAPAKPGSRPSSPASARQANQQGNAPAKPGSRPSSPASARQANQQGNAPAKPGSRPSSPASKPPVKAAEGTSNQMPPPTGLPPKKTPATPVKPAATGGSPKQAPKQTTGVVKQMAKPAPKLSSPSAASPQSPQQGAALKKTPAGAGSKPASAAAKLSPSTSPKPAPSSAASKQTPTSAASKQTPTSAASNPSTALKPATSTAASKSTPAGVASKPPPPRAPSKPTPASAASKPTPASSASKPTPASSASKPTPASSASKPTPASSASKPTPASSASKPTPASSASKPTPASSASKPTPASSASKPTLASAASKLTPASSASKPTSASTATKPTPASAASKLPTTSSASKPTPASAASKPTPASAASKLPPTSSASKPTPASAASKPTPTSSASKPTPTSAAPKPSPTSAAPKPSPTSAASKPSPTSAASKPSPISAASKPTPTGVESKPTPTGVESKPTPTGAASKPSPTGAASKPSSTSEASKPSPTSAATKPIPASASKPTPAGPACKATPTSPACKPTPASAAPEAAPAPAGTEQPSTPLSKQTLTSSPKTVGEATVSAGTCEKTDAASMPAFSEEQAVLPGDQVVKNVDEAGPSSTLPLVSVERKDPSPTEREASGAPATSTEAQVKSSDPERSVTTEVALPSSEENPAVSSSVELPSPRISQTGISSTSCSLDVQHSDMVTDIRISEGQAPKTSSAKGEEQQQNGSSADLQKSVKKSSACSSKETPSSTSPASAEGEQS